MKQILLYKDGHNYVIQKDEKRELFPDWLSLQKNMRSLLTSYPIKQEKEDVEPKVRGKVEMGRNEEVVLIPCINCGGSFPWPIDSKYYPSLCSDRCKCEYETEVETNENKKSRNKN